MRSKSKSRLPHTWTIVLIAVVLLIGCGALAVWWPYQQNQRVIALVERLGGETTSEIIRPVWIPQAVDEAYLGPFERIIRISMDPNVSDADLKHLQNLINLKVLTLDDSQVTDAGLEHLQVLTNLDLIYLHDTSVSDAGLEHLRELKKLEWLTLGSTQVSDKGLKHLHDLYNLELLDLRACLLIQEFVGSSRLSIR